MKTFVVDTECILTIRSMLTPAALHPTQGIRQVKVNPKKNNIVSSFVDQFLRKKNFYFEFT